MRYAAALFAACLAAWVYVLVSQLGHRVEVVIPAVPEARAGVTGYDWVAEWRRRFHKERRANRAHAELVRDLRRQLELDPAVGAAICAVFGPYCGQAKTVAWCESHYDTRAHNGQYLGIFQMGSRERATYGHGDSAIEQALAAWRYFAASGHRWTRWECKP